MGWIPAAAFSLCLFSQPLLAADLQAGRGMTGPKAQIAFVKELDIQLGRLPADASALASHLEQIKPAKPSPPRRLAVEALLGTIMGRVQFSALSNSPRAEPTRAEAATKVDGLRNSILALDSPAQNRLLRRIAETRKALAPNAASLSGLDDELNAALKALFDGGPTAGKASSNDGLRQRRFSRIARTSPWGENPMGDYFERAGVPNVHVQFKESVLRKEHQDSISLVNYNVAYLFFRLPPEYQALLSRFGVKFYLNDHPRWGGYAHPRQRTINLRTDPLTGFMDDGKKIAGGIEHWRCAEATMKEEVRHYLAALLKFDTKVRWKKPAFLEIDNMTPQALALIGQMSRRYDYDVLADLRKRWRGWQPSELLVKILEIRDILRESSLAARSPKSDEQIDKRMRAAFPRTYDLALEFEQTIVREADLPQP